MHFRTARANWTPTDWGKFCRRALVDANTEYRRQLLRQATPEDLSAMYRDLMQRRDAKERERDAIEEQLSDIDREFALRRAT